ncbi:MAG: molecular chaperone DnaK, partial [Spirochaetota bacterium]
IEAAITDLKKVMDGSDVELMKQKTETLKQASYKLAEEMYKNAAPSQGAEGGPGPQGGSGGAGPQPGASSGPASGSADDVDYRVVDEEEKK